ncbi:hypothetical protein QBC33DRAFT_519537 [Phialemonium atrogriseum]|uniref:PD-(D/E)XK nuclease-like domain-containing protein n=1 Tax=Phialemonium atrogriseum TaxID=1093897 RepID=A0AAJ0BQL3_9PEZI|nr:uncharacterized protein QBC33DRAFT_519537 [Phialemonium atrogriseum]KAK1762451.1 hypothetical protein QBC33DRAFT_519537 [Phialemonium atrogriseum]
MAYFPLRPSTNPSAASVPLSTMTTTTTTTTPARNKSRSRSPTKRAKNPADLQLSALPVQYVTSQDISKMPDDVQSLIDNVYGIVSVAGSSRIIPSAVKEHEQMSEAVWNEQVHSRLLEVGLQPFPSQLDYYNITAADIHPDFLSRDATQTTSLQGKRVNYAIVLDNEATRQHCVELLREKTLSICSSINHTEQSSLHFRQLAVSIET